MGSSNQKYVVRGVNRAGLHLGIGRNAVIIVGVALALGLAVGTERVVPLLPFIAAAAAVVAFWRPQWMLLCIIVLGFTLDYVIYVLSLPSAAGYLLDLLVLVLAITTLTYAALRGKIRLGSPVILLWMLIVVVALLLGRKHDIYSLQSVVGFVLFPLLFLAVLNMPLSERMERRTGMLILGLALLQVPATVIQKYVLGFTDVDQVGGTLGRAGTTHIAVLMAGVFVFLLCYVVVRSWWKGLPLLVVPIVPMLLGEAKAGFLLASLGALVVLALLIWQRASFSSISVVIGSIFLPIASVFLAYRYVPALFLTSPDLGNRFLQALFTREGLSSYLGGYGASGQALRSTAFQVVWRTLTDTSSLPLGQGPGILSTSALFGDAAQPTIQGLAWISSGGRYLLETGLIGLTIFCAAVLHVVGQCRVLLDSRQAHPRVLGMTVFAVSLIFLAGGFYTSTWHADATSVSFWVLAGLAFRLGIRLKDECPLPEG